MIEHLYTPTDVKRVRDRLIKEQQGIDPILKEPFKETVALDHSHLTQRVRGALNRNTNAFEGLVWNAHLRCLKWLTDLPLPEILRNLADYYEDTDRLVNNPLHPGWIKRVQIDFNSLNEGSKKIVLEALKQPHGVNGADRKKLFKKAILTKQFTFEQVKKLIQTEKDKTK